MDAKSHQQRAREEHFAVRNLKPENFRVAQVVNILDLLSTTSFRTEKGEDIGIEAEMSWRDVESSNGGSEEKKREENNISTTITDDDDVEKKLKTVKLNSLRILLRAADFSDFSFFFFRILFFQISESSLGAFLLGTWHHHYVSSLAV